MTTLPATIIMVRHGEKPGDPGKDSDSDGPDLSPKGYIRANALAPMIPSRYGRPDFIFATRASKASNRPVETITPLARSLSLSINDNFGDADYKDLPRHIFGESVFSDKLIVICWHHGTIVELAKEFGADVGKLKWDGDVFDRVLRIHYKPGKISFFNEPQKLIFGDSKD